jgi:RNA polymerase sigma factor (sigma-70 family)
MDTTRATGVTEPRTEDPPGAEDEEERFRSVFEANYTRLVGYAVRRTSSAEDAADAVAETFLTAWRRLDVLPVGEAATLWLYGTIRRVLANQRRSEGRRSHLSDKLALELASMGLRSDHSTSDTGSIATAFRGLSPADRDLLGLVVWENLGPSDLAVVLGCSTNAAKIRLHRARRHLARLLAQADADPEQFPLNEPVRRVVGPYVENQEI